MSLRHKPLHVDQPTARDIRRRLGLVRRSTTKNVDEISERKIKRLMRRDRDNPTLHIVIILFIFFVILRVLFTFGSVNIYRSASETVGEKFDKGVKSADSWFEDTYDEYFGGNKKRRRRSRVPASDNRF